MKNELKGQFGTFIVYNRVLSQAERIAVYNRLIGIKTPRTFKSICMRILYKIRQKFYRNERR